jgi:hypothetical protein
VWAALYPRAEVAHTLPTTSLMAGLLGPGRRHLGIDFQLAAHQVFAALAADAEILSTIAAPGQALPQATLHRPLSVPGPGQRSEGGCVRTAGCRGFRANRSGDGASR